MSMNPTIYATFADPDMAQKAAGALLDHGVSARNLSIIFPESYAGEDYKDGHDMEKSAEKGISTTTTGDAMSGAAKGAGLGLAAGALAALAAVFVPGVGLVLGSGALATAIGGVAGTTAAGAVAGGVTGYLKDQGVPDEVVTDYDRVLGSGGATLTVMAGDDNVTASEIQDVITKYEGTVGNYNIVAKNPTVM
jgi:hypothetical protein